MVVVGETSLESLDVQSFFLQLSSVLILRVMRDFFEVEYVIVQVLYVLNHHFSSVVNIVFILQSLGIFEVSENVIDFSIVGQPILGEKVHCIDVMSAF